VRVRVRVGVGVGVGVEVQRQGERQGGDDQSFKIIIGILQGCVGRDSVRILLWRWS
jgi:hypothetical protein